MPEAEIKARGGAKRWRTMSLPGGKYIHVAVVKKAGPRGGHTISGPERTAKNTGDGGGSGEMDWNTPPHKADEMLKKKGY